MPKLKSHRGAKKRFKLTATGKIKRKRAYLRHLLAAKSKRQKRALRKPGYVFKGEAKTIRTLISV
ncbi:MAG: 50S ribosomal protein L35 [bacterium]|nr:50S ribosomal protein L35 [bacterium]